MQNGCDLSCCTLRLEAISRLIRITCLVSLYKFGVFVQLKEIEKNRYRKHFRFVFAGIVVVLTVVALGLSTLVVHLFGTPGESHFWFNLGGVVVAAVVVVIMLTKLRSHPFMLEVVYVWDLKQQLNRIYRKQNKIEPLIENGHHDAMIVMNFFYRGSKQLYELDDNTITMDTLGIKLRALEKRMEGLGMSTSTDAYHPDMLERF